MYCGGVAFGDKIGFERAPNIDIQYYYLSNLYRFRSQDWSPIEHTRHLAPTLFAVMEELV
jgi:hypothetical protein